MKDDATLINLWMDVLCGIYYNIQAFGIKFYRIMILCEYLIVTMSRLFQIHQNPSIIMYPPLKLYPHLSLY